MTRPAPLHRLQRWISAHDGDALPRRSPDLNRGFPGLMATRPRRGPRSAVAIRYDLQKDRAPRIIGKGKGELAERMLAIAKEHKIPVREDPELIEVLAKLDVQEEIPPELYQVMAEVLTFIYRVNKKKGVPVRK